MALIPKVEEVDPPTISQQSPVNDNEYIELVKIEPPMKNIEENPLKVVQRRPQKFYKCLEPKCERNFSKLHSRLYHMRKESHAVENLTGLNLFTVSLFFCNVF